MKLIPYAKVVVQNDASDLHLRSNTKPMIRINGELWPLDMPPLSKETVQSIILETMTDEIADIYREMKEVDYSLEVPEVGRFRANAFTSTEGPGLVLRRIYAEPKTMDELKLPPVFEEMCNSPMGLILVTGPTGSGKTTTLSAMIDYINKTRRGHILTIEDPIEFTHKNIMAMITQREVRTDTYDYATALKSALRQDPDVIMLGEIRDVETVESALQAAETGHLVLATLHTSTVAETVTRIVDMFPPHARDHIRQSLAGSVRGVVCQRLLKTADDKGRVAVMEIAVGTNRITEAIADPEKVHDIEQIVSEGSHYGMKTFQQDLVRLTIAGTISVDAALMAAPNQNDFKVALKRAGMTQ